MTPRPNPGRLPRAPLRSPEALQAYSGEHLRYEMNMFFGAIAARHGTIVSDAPQLEAFFRNARVEAFANHLRNLITFLHPDEYPVRPGDVCAHHFIRAEDALAFWVKARGPLSASLRAAKDRADKEMAHLTAGRLDPADPNRPWEMVSLGWEICGVLRAFVDAADPQLLSAAVSESIPGDVA